MSTIPTLQKLMDGADEFGEGDCRENEARRASVSINKPIKVDHPSADHVSYIFSNLISKNVSKYLTPDAKKALNQLRQPFTKAPILQYFDPEQYIWVETYTSGHIIGGVLSQPPNDLGRWHLLVYLSCKIILAKTQYKTHDSKLFAIIESFKI